MKGYNWTSTSSPLIIPIAFETSISHRQRPNEEKKEEGEGERRKRTTLALTKSPNLKQSPILILSLSVNLISASLMTPVKSSLDSGTGLLFDI
jgi:hypothetical protein